jgi:hypothetical protein
MEKNKKPVSIVELEIEPLADEDLAAISAAEAVPYSYCTCRIYQSDSWTCGCDIA